MKRASPTPISKAGNDSKDYSISPWVTFPSERTHYRQDPRRGQLLVRLVVQETCDYSVMDPYEVMGAVCMIGWGVRDPDDEEGLLSQLLTPANWFLDKPGGGPARRRGAHALADTNRYANWLPQGLGDLSNLDLIEAPWTESGEAVAMLSLGTLPHVPVHQRTKRPWRCFSQLLSLRGKHLIHHLSALYPGTSLMLVTVEKGGSGIERRGW